MACEDKKTAFDNAIQSATQKLKDGLASIAKEAERKAGELTQQIDQGQDLAGGVGAATGAVIGGVFGGPAGAAIGGDLGKQIGSLFVLKVEMQTVKFALDVPQVSMQLQSFSFDSPVIVMQDKDMSFDLPEITMVRRPGPDKPEMTCRMETRDLGLGVKIDVPVCYMEMTPTYLDLPEVTMKTHRIVVGLPNVTMVAQSFSLDVPEIRMDRQEMSFEIPSISLTFIENAGQDTAKAAASIAQEAQTASMQKQASMREELRLNMVGPCTAMFDCYRQQLNSSRLQVLAMFDPQINQITESIKALLLQGVAEAAQEVTELRQKLDSIVAQRDKAVTGIDEAIANVAKAANKAIDQFINRDPEDETVAADAA